MTYKLVESEEYKTKKYKSHNKLKLAENLKGNFTTLVIKIIGYTV